MDVFLDFDDENGLTDLTVHEANDGKLITYDAATGEEVDAEGEAEAATIITKAMERTGNGIIEVRRIDAAKEIAGKLANSRNVVYLPNTGAGGNGSGSNLLLGLDAK